MKLKDLPCMFRPCNDCPFRKDSNAISQMETIVPHFTHVCHKTQDLPEEQQKQCAGHMMVNKEKNRFYLLAKAIYPNFLKKLKGQELLFDSPEETIQHHSKHFRNRI